jgi:hypothetical protein
LEAKNTTQGRRRRRRIVIVLAVCVLAGIGVVAFWPGEKEPEYNGKKLSEWLQAYELGYSNDAEERIFEREQKAAANAIQHIGTNALPWLLRWIAYDPPAWKEKIGRFVVKIRSKTVTRWYVKGYRLRFDAVQGFRVLGPNAAPAVAELERIVKGSRCGFGQQCAMDALGCVGKDGLSVIIAALENKKTSHTAAVCILGLSEGGVDVSSAIPALLSMDRERYKIAVANPGFEHFYWIPHVDQNPPNIAPALINCLHHTNSAVRAEAAHALGLIGERALPAVPALKEALDVRVIALQEAALNALEKIAPEVLTNGVKDF